jgi:hypothetical protein
MKKNILQLFIIIQTPAIFNSGLPAVLNICKPDVSPTGHKFPMPLIFKISSISVFQSWPTIPAICNADNYQFFEIFKIYL